VAKRPVDKKLSDEELKSILQAERSAALGSSTSSDLSDQRIKALDYYMGDMSGTMPNEDGLSSAVSSDVQDVIEGLLPIILDIFVSNDKVVEFKPQHPGDEAAAEQETDYVNHVFYQENDGFLTLYSAIKDGLLSKNCFVKWWMEEVEDRDREDYEGLTEDAFAMLAADKDVTIVGTPEKYEQTDPNGGAPVTMYNAVVETVKKTKRPKIMAVPPEEILISKNARSVADATYMCHIGRKPMADVIAQYPDKTDEIKATPSAVTTSDNYEAFARQTVQDNQDQLQTADDVNTGMRLIEIAEHYCRMAMENDGVARRYKITTIGTKMTILDCEEVKSWPFATGTPIIMQHRFFGRSVADLVIDIQEIKTALYRAVLNNAYFANNQRIEIAETHATENTIDDLLNNRVGGIVRTKMPGGLEPIPTQPIGHWIMPTIEYVDSVRENRTGASRYNQGLDADTLNHTATGVTRLMDAGEMRVKLIARIFAETLFVNMFRGLHEMLQEHSEAEQVVELRGQWVPVNPREWATRRHMTVALPLGGASKQQLTQFFMGLLNVQKEAITTQGGVNGPLVSLQNIYNTAEQLTKLAGLKSVQPFFMQPPPPDPNAPKPPDPRMVEAQGKVQAAAAEQQSDAQMAQQQFAADQQMENMKLAAARQREQDEFEHKRQLDVMRFEHDTQMEQLKLGMQMRLEAFKTTEAARLNEQQARLDRTTDSPV
jgi:hypothetical protein